MDIKRFTNFLVLILFSAVTLTVLQPDSTAQDYTQMGLPEGPKARLSKGSISGIAYSPDGMLLAVSTNIGVWLLDAQSGKELKLIASPTNGITR